MRVYAKNIQKIVEMAKKMVTPGTQIWERVHLCTMDVSCLSSFNFFGVKRETHGQASEVG